MLQLTNEKTSKVLLTSSSNSEWDFSNYAIVTLPDVEYIKSIIEGVKYLISDGFLSVSYSYDNQVFLNTEDDLLTVDQNFMFVENAELSKDMLEELGLPEQSMQYGIMKISKGHGDSDTFFISFESYGKHTSEEFCTNEIQISELYNL